MRLIDADELLNQLNFCESKENKFDGTMESICNSYFSKMLEMFIIKAPIIEAEPVKHGKWISELIEDKTCFGEKFNEYQPISCSSCHKPVTVHYNFCPYCGAKMDLRD